MTFIASAVVALSDALRGAFTPLAHYNEGQWVTRANTIYGAKEDFTAGAVFDPDDWDVVLQGEGVLARSTAHIDRVSMAETSFAALPDLASITFDVIELPVEIELWLPWIVTASADNIFSLALLELAPTFGTQRVDTDFYRGVAFAEDSCRIECTIDTPGTYTLAPVYKKAGSGAIGMLNATNEGGAKLTARQVAL